MIYKIKILASILLRFNTIHTYNFTVFKSNASIDKSISHAKKAFLNSVDSLGLDHLRFADFGKEHCKMKGVSPDSVLQLAIQVYLSITIKFISYF